MMKPVKSVTAVLLKGERNSMKINIGRAVKKTVINLLVNVILCVVLHSLHSIGL